MPRTFSLANLFAGITLLCLICGLLVSGKETVVAYLLTVACFMPAAAMGLIFARFTRRRMATLLATLAGGGLGVASGLPTFALHGPMTVWQAIGPVFMPTATQGVLGAFLFGVLALVLISESTNKEPFS